MKTRTLRTDIAHAATWIARNIQTNPAIPSLAGTLLTATDDTLTLETRDPDALARITIPAHTKNPGTALVNGKILAGFLASANADHIDLEIDGPNLNVSAGKTRMAFGLMDTTTYPEWPDTPPTTHTLDRQAAIKAASQTAPAASRDSKSNLDTINLHLNGDTLKLAATDRYRAAITRIPAAGNGPNAEAVIRASKVLEAFRSMDGETIRIGIGPARTTIATDTSTKVLIHTPFQYPAIEPLFERETLGAITLDRQTALESVNMAILVSDTNRVTLDVGLDTLKIDATGTRGATYTDTLDIETEGDLVTLTANPLYLKDLLSAFGTDTITLAHTGPHTPALASAEGEALRYLFVPLRR